MLGARIALLRRQAGMSQAEFAKRLGISPSTVGMYEQGRREPALEILVSMARLLEVSTDYLLTGKSMDKKEEKLTGQAIMNSLISAQARQEKRPQPPFSRQELAVLFAAMLME